MPGNWATIPVKDIKQKLQDEGEIKGNAKPQFQNYGKNFKAEQLKRAEYSEN